MATITTSIGPVGARQINRNFFVGQSDLGTIQKAVTAAVASGGGCVIIPAGYAGSDAIASATGGNATVYISDQRIPQQQNYTWSSSAYVPADMSQLTGYIAMGVPEAPPGSISMGIDPLLGEEGSAYILATAPATKGMPSFSLILYPQDGSAGETAVLQCGPNLNGVLVSRFKEQIEIVAADSTTALWLGQEQVTNGKGLAITAKAANNLITLQGMTYNAGFDQTISLNPQGGEVQIGPLTFDGAGNIIGIKTLTAVDAQFATCEVANSPVRTFANTGDAPAGMVWPPIGIAVSTGSAWGTSINPATLVIYPPAGIAQSTGTAWGAPISVASLATWPAAGVPVSTGAAWGTSIPTANIPLLNAANTFTPDQSFTGNLHVGGSVSTSNLTATSTATTSGAAILTFAPNLAVGNTLSIYAGQSNSVGNAAFLGFRYQGNSNVINSGLIGVVGGASASFNPAGDWSFPTSLTTAGTLTAHGVLNVIANGATTSAANGLTVTWNLKAGTGETDFINASAGAGGGFYWFNVASNTPVTSSTNPGMWLDSGNVLHTAGAKAFSIPHPLDDSKTLTHYCLEGPEIAVFYRGEGMTESGWAEIILPDYFEALTIPEDRTVLLTALFEDEAEQVGMLAASRVKAGKFKVWSGLPTQKFYWEVKAVRGNIAPRVVELNRTIQGDEAECK